MSSVENKIKDPPSMFKKVGGSVRRFGSRTIREQNKLENKSRTEPPKYPLKRCCMTQLEDRRISYLVISLGTTGWRFESSPVHQLFLSALLQAWLKFVPRLSPPHSKAHTPVYPANARNPISVRTCSPLSLASLLITVKSSLGCLPASVYRVHLLVVFSAQFIVATGWAPLPGPVGRFSAKGNRDRGAVNDAFKENFNCRSDFRSEGPAKTVSKATLRTRLLPQPRSGEPPTAIAWSKIRPLQPNCLTTAPCSSPPAGPCRRSASRLRKLPITTFPS